MGCTPTIKHPINQPKTTNNSLQPPEIDNETEFYSSRSSTEVPNSQIPDLPMESQDIARKIRRPQGLAA